ncbi:peptide chain release factor N(5)-glutamine methyltransferase [Thiovibrio sp. JS02]
MTIGQFYRVAVERLVRAGIAEPEVEASILFGHVLHCGRAQLFLNAQQEVREEDRLLLEGFLARRQLREPLAYILGEQEFWSLPFQVCPQVLIPRPETEELLEKVFATAKEQGLPPGPVLDLGVGSGAITVVLARELPERKVLGVDRSLAALRVAEKNIARHRVEARAFLLNADWLTALAEKRIFSLVVSNPPYISAVAFASLQPEVRDFEPLLALTSGRDGLDAIRTLAGGVPRVLRPGGYFFMEIGFDQKEAVLNIFSSLPEYDSVQVYHDLAGLPRILRARCR